MQVGIFGYKGDDPEDPFILTGAGGLDEQVFAGPVAKERREDLQILGFMSALTYSGRGRHPVTIELGADPPDRWITSGTDKWSTELTELTLQDVRRDIAPVRRLGRQLRRRILDTPSKYEHLNGGLVTLTMSQSVRLPTAVDPLLRQLEAALQVDRGFFGDEANQQSGAAPQAITRGIYGQVGPFQVIVNRSERPTSIPSIAASVQMEISLSEAIAALNERILAKDDPRNSLLVITCGLPDPQGYRCPLDSIIFHLLSQAQATGRAIVRQKPQHIQGVAVHMWDTGHLTVWGDGESRLPWTLVT